MKDKFDYDLQTLLDLSGHVYYLEGGKCWVKFSACRVVPSEFIPHEIKYSLTLHDRNNTRIVGYDNAHDCLPKSKPYRARKVTWDHVHKKEKVEPYEFDSASQLMDDFWKTVNRFI
jgi:hypothetical protein